MDLEHHRLLDRALKAEEEAGQLRLRLAAALREISELHARALDAALQVRPATTDAPAHAPGQVHRLIDLLRAARAASPRQPRADPPPAGDDDRLGGR